MCFFVKAEWQPWWGMCSCMLVHELLFVCVRARDPMSSHYGESGRPSSAPTSVSENGGAPHRALSQPGPGGEAVFCCITSHTAAPRFSSLHRLLNQHLHYFSIDSFPAHLVHLLFCFFFFVFLRTSQITLQFCLQSNKSSKSNVCTH